MIEQFNEFLMVGALVVLTAHAILLHWRVAQLWRVHQLLFSKFRFDDEEK